MRDLLKQLTPYEKVMIARSVIRERQEHFEDKMNEDMIYGSYSEHLVEADDILEQHEDEVKTKDELFINVEDL